MSSTSSDNSSQKDLTSEILRSVSTALMYSEVVQNTFIRKWLSIWPIIIFPFIFLQLYNILWVGPWLLVFFALVVACSRWGLLHRIQKPFVDLWKLQIVDIGAGPVYQRFVFEFQKSLNGKNQYLSAFIFALLGFIAAFDVRSWPYLWDTSGPKRECGILFNCLLGNPEFLVRLIMYTLTGFLLGLVAWRMLIVGRNISRLLKEKGFEITPLVGYPDGCGGLEPLGNLVLWNAIIISIPAFFLGFYGIVAPVNDELLQLWFIILLLVLIIIANLSFFRPLMNIHRVLIDKRDSDWAKLGKRINELVRLMPDQETNSADKEKNEAREKELTMLQEHAKLYPTWPLRIQPIIIFVSVQLVAIIGMLKNLNDLLSSLG